MVFAATLSGAVAQNCRATYRPVIVDLNEETYDNQGNKEMVLTRMNVDYVELSTLDSSEVYVSPMGCALDADGKTTHRRPKRTLKLGCSDPDDAANCPAEETFWKDPLKYACGEKEVYDWMSGGNKMVTSCAVEDPFQGYGTANVCCPLDKPNFYVFDKEAGSNSNYRRRLLSQQEKGSSTLTSRTRQKLGKSQGITITSRTPQKLSKPNSLRRRLSQTAPYGDDSYGGGDSYGGSDSYGAYDSYGDHDSYVAYDSYGDHDSYGAYDSYGDHDSYGAYDSYGDHDSYGGWEEETLVGICSAAELPTLDMFSYEPVDWSDETFTPDSDMVNSVAFGDLGLTSLKQLYQLYDQDASEMTQGLVYGASSECEADTMAFTMPPFGADVVSSFFAHVFNNPVPGNDEINSVRKLTPFSGAKSKEDTDGVCKMIVTLRDYPEVEGEIMKIDGVDFSCLQAAYEKVPDAYVALDAYTALARATGSVPALGDNITVTIRDLTDDSVTDYSVMATFSNYASLKSKLDSRNDEAMWGWGSKPMCGHMTYMRWDGQVAPGERTCPRSTTVADRPEAEREAAFETMVENKIGFAVFGQAVSVKTGKKSEGMNNDKPPNFDPEKQGGTCKFSVYGLMDKNGDAVCAEPVTVNRARGHCSFDDFKKIADDIVSVIDRADKKITTSDSPDYLVHTGKDMWVECMDIFRKSAVEGATKTVQRVTDECVKDLPEGAWDYWPLCSEYAKESYPDVYDPTNAYCKDPCCNLDLQSSMCCMSQEVSYEVPAPTFDFAAFSDLCYVSDARAQVAGGSDASAITESNPQNAMDPATKIFERSINPASCLKATETMATVVEGIEDDLTCCLTAVTGEWSWEKNSFLSTQPCNGAGDCLSGSCISTTENTNPDKDGACWPARTAFTNACAVA